MVSLKLDVSSTRNRCCLRGFALPERPRVRKSALRTYISSLTHLLAHESRLIEEAEAKKAKPNSKAGTKKRRCVKARLERSVRGTAATVIGTAAMPFPYRAPHQAAHTAPARRRVGSRARWVWQARPEHQRQSAQHPSCLVRRECLVERAGRVGRQIIDNDTDTLSCGEVN